MRQRAALLLPNTGIFRASVCAVGVTDLSDALKSCASSDGVIFDDTPPIAGSVCVGIGNAERCGGEQFVAESMVTLRWHGFSDGQTGIGDFGWAVGTSAGIDDVRAWETIGLATTASLSGALVGYGRVAHVSVSCSNGAGLNTTASIRLIFDTTPPTFTEAASWWAGSGVVFESDSLVRLAWPSTAAVDEESGVLLMRLQVFQAPDAALVLDWNVSAEGAGNVLLIAEQHVLFTAYLLLTNRAGLEAMSIALAIAIADLRPLVVWVNI